MFTLSASSVFWAVGRKRPPLCRGCAPATPPYKNMPHPPYAVIPAVRPVEGGGGQRVHDEIARMSAGLKVWSKQALFMAQ